MVSKASKAYFLLGTRHVSRQASSRLSTCIRFDQTRPILFRTGSVKSIWRSWVPLIPHDFFNRLCSFCGYLVHACAPRRSSREMSECRVVAAAAVCATCVRITCRSFFRRRVGFVHHIQRAEEGAVLVSACVLPAGCSHKAPRSANMSWAQDCTMYL